MKNILITGAASGLGLTTATHFASKGWRVFALDFQATSIPQMENIVPIFVDVSTDESVKNAINEVKKHCSNLDIIVNFAGILQLGSTVEVEPESMQRILNINVVGTYRINYYCFPLFQKGSRVINISSESGVLSPPPFSGFYYTSKHAIECYTDAMRRELRFLDIPVIKIRPGAFKTQMQGNALKRLEEIATNSQYFKQQIEKGNSMAERGTGNAKEPELLAQLIFEAATTKHPKIAYNINRNKLFILLSWLPEKWQDWIYFKTLK
jgi:NAD(P)-dependent dehydrogenase (short-subunit alcohol dehydrogenase family)